LAFLDISKAFDRDWRDGLFALLWENGIKDEIFALILLFSSMFAKSVIKIEKSVGDKTQPCFDPNSWSNQSDSKSPNTNTDDKQYLK
jgi:hypothetical protein